MKGTLDKPTNTISVVAMESANRDRSCVHLEACNPAVNVPRRVVTFGQQRPQR